MKKIILLTAIVIGTQVGALPVTTPQSNFPFPSRDLQCDQRDANGGSGIFWTHEIMLRFNSEMDTEIVLRLGLSYGVPKDVCYEDTMLLVKTSDHRQYNISGNIQCRHEDQDKTCGFQTQKISFDFDKTAMKLSYAGVKYDCHWLPMPF